MTISNVNRLVPGLVERLEPSPAKATATTEQTKETFTDMFKDLLADVNEVHQASGELQKALVAGEPVQLHQVMIKAREAGVATDLLLEIRNKLLNAYNELMRMPV